MIAAMRASGKLFAINWPLAWYPPHVTAKRLVRRGGHRRGDRGPLLRRQPRPAPSHRGQGRDIGRRSGSGRSRSPGSTRRRPAAAPSWTTWATGRPWEAGTTTGQGPHRGDLRRGRAGRPGGGRAQHHRGPLRAAACRSSRRGGAPSPTPGRTSRCPGAGSSSWERREASPATISRRPSACRRARIPPGRDVPVDTLAPPRQNPVQYFIHCLETGEPLHGPLSPEICRIGQRIVDSAVLSALHKHTVRLL